MNADGRTDETVRSQHGSIEGDEVLLEVCRVLFTDELLNLVRVNIVAADRVVLVVARQVVLIILVIFACALLESGIRLPEDACPLSMGELTTLCLADTCVAEVRAFDDVAIGAADALVAVAVKAKGLAHWSTWRQNTVSIQTFTGPAVALGIMQAVWRALRNQVMGQVTLVSGSTSPLLEIFFACSNPGWIVDVAAHGALWT